MGGGISSQRSPQRPAHRVIEKQESIVEEIDVLILFSALHKLSYLFDIKYSMTTSLIAEIYNPMHVKFEDQFLAVINWVERHSDASMTVAEVCCLIKYVELYKPPAEDSVTTTVALMSTQCRLLCPYLSEKASWTAEIRHQELHKSSPLHTDTTTRLQDDFSGESSTQ
jgi:hypothetical protein